MEKWRKWFLGALVAGAILAHGTPANAQSRSRESCSNRNTVETIRTTVTPLIDNGLVRVNVQGAQVSPNAWLALDYEQKRQLSWMLGVYRSCIYWPATDPKRQKLASEDVKIFDKQSGRKLAEWDSYFGRLNVTRDDR